MSGFFKSFGRGILYVIFLPFILLCLALYSVVGIIILFLFSIKSIVLFFKAKTIFSPLEEDEQAALILHKTKDIQQKIISNQTSEKTVNETKTTNNIFILSNDQLKNINNPQDIIDQIDNTPLQITNKNEEDYIDEEEIENNEIHIERNNSNNKIDNVNNEKEESNFIDEPIPHEAEIEEENEKPTSTINISNKNNYYKPKDTSIDEEDYDFSYEEEEEKSNGVTFKEYRGDDND